MSSTTIKEVITGIEAQIVAAPSLGIQVSDLINAPQTMPQQRGATGVSVKREITINLNETRNQDNSRVQDIVAVEIQIRVNPKDQKVSRNAAYDLENALLNRISSLTFERRWNMTHLDTREQVQGGGGEWFTVLIRYSLKRFEPVGAG